MPKIRNGPIQPPELVASQLDAPVAIDAARPAASLARIGAGAAKSAEQLQQSAIKAGK